MRLELGRRADYAVRATVDLARHQADESRRKARDIASEMDIPPSYVPQILADLVRADLVTSMAGPRGGHALARDPEQITLLEVLHAVDGATPSATCVLRSGPCRWNAVCAVHVPWARAQQALLDVLGRTTLHDVVVADRQLDVVAFTLPDDVAAPARSSRVGT
ncbi:MAG: Rrf2 family transcriptional regulator [Nitriliruptoraceae bacterium]